MGPLAALAIPTIAQTGLGLYQMIKGGRMANDNVQPKMVMPSSFEKAIASVQRRAESKTMPGEDRYKAALDEMMSGSMAQFLGSVSSAGDLSQGLTSLQGNRMRQENDLAMRRENYLDSMDNRLEEWLGKAADWENLIWQTNELQPYQQKAAAASALKGAGIQNMMGALNNMALYGAMNPSSPQTKSASVGASSNQGEVNPNNAGGSGQAFSPTGTVGNPSSVVPEGYEYLFSGFQVPNTLSW